MKRAALLLSLSLAVGIAVGVIGMNALHAQSEPVKRTVLLKARLTEVRMPQGTVLLAELAPGAETGKHEHPGDEMAYVLGGSVTVEVDGQAPVTFKAGDAFYQPMGQPHTVKNASTTAPAKVLMVLVEKGMRKRKGERLPLVEPGQPSPPLTPRTP